MQCSVHTKSIINISIFLDMGKPPSCSSSRSAKFAQLENHNFRMPAHRTAIINLFFIDGLHLLFSPKVGNVSIEIIQKI